MTTLSTIITTTGVKFGTSGVRGLSVDITDFVAYSYTTAFLNFVLNKYQNTFTEVGIAGDFRESTPRIRLAIAKAVADKGLKIVDCGLIPTPALTLWGIKNRVPTIMVTGSHIPADRNGFKFNTPEGEILKRDEPDILAQELQIDLSLFNEKGNFLDTPFVEITQNEIARAEYINRYVEFFGQNSLEGIKIGVYGHSSVGRDVICEVVAALGGVVEKLGYSDIFIPVDTEALREEDRLLAKEWTTKNKYFAIFSADGDADRPLIFDENGEWIRGDILGVLVAKFLGADFVAAPISVNSVVDKSNFFSKVVKTKIGSPYVISAMQQSGDVYSKIVGYEANGGFLIQSDIDLDGRVLSALPTRDALIALLSITISAIKQGVSLSQLLQSLPKRFTDSDRIKDFPVEKSKKIVEKLNSDDSFIFKLLDSEAAIKSKDNTDGIRFTLDNDEIVHIRPSGNAPELRIYTEADSLERANFLQKRVKSNLQGMM